MSQRNLSDMSERGQFPPLPLVARRHPSEWLEIQFGPWSPSIVPPDTWRRQRQLHETREGPNSLRIRLPKKPIAVAESRPIFGPPRDQLRHRSCVRKSDSEDIVAVGVRVRVYCSCSISAIESLPICRIVVVTQPCSVVGCRTKTGQSDDQTGMCGTCWVRRFRAETLIRNMNWLKVAKLVRMLSSPNDGEVINAART